MGAGGWGCGWGTGARAAGISWQNGTARGGRLLTAVDCRFPCGLGAFRDWVGLAAFLFLKPEFRDTPSQTLETPNPCVVTPA